MEYQVPQFIEVEDKVIGPLSLKQFIYIAGAGGLCIVFFFYLPFIAAILCIIPTAGLGLALAFYKVNGKPFIEILEAGFNFLVGSKLFLWKHPEEKMTSTKVVQKAPEVPAALPGAPRLSRGKLTELAWSLDVKKSAPSERES